MPIALHDWYRLLAERLSKSSEQDLGVLKKLGLPCVYTFVPLGNMDFTQMTNRLELFRSANHAAPAVDGASASVLLTVTGNLLFQHQTRLFAPET